MKYDFDLICIGLGPAGMAISVMGAEMGLSEGQMPNIKSLVSKITDYIL